MAKKKDLAPSKEEKMIPARTKQGQRKTLAHQELGNGKDIKSRE